MSSDVRDIDRLLRDLGYTLVRDNGHPQYEHSEHPALSLASSPSDHRWRKNTMAELRRRHPELRPKKAAPETRAARKRSKRSTSRAGSPLPPRVALTPQERWSLYQRPSLAERLGVTPPERVPNPGSAAAKSLGCTCPRDQSHYGAGGDGKDWLNGGRFAVLAGCPIHDEPAPSLDANVARCSCGNAIQPHNGPGRPRKWCETCRPSQWKHLSEDRRATRREDRRRWYLRVTHKEST